MDRGIDASSTWEAWSRNPVTGLPGRRAIRHALRREVARAERHGHTLGVALIDPGISPAVHGEYLCELCYAICLALRAGDEVCIRDSGDILLLLPEIPADRLGVRLRAVSTAASAAVSSAAGMPMLRWGAALYPRDGQCPDSLLRASLAAMTAGSPAGND